jgi:hypothetical protein
MNKNQRDTIKQAVKNVFGQAIIIAPQSGNDYLKFFLNGRKKSTLEYHYRTFSDGDVLLAKLSLRIPSCKVRTAGMAVDEYPMTVTGQKALIQSLLVGVV